jgi:hypothetical protein
MWNHPLPFRSFLASLQRRVSLVVLSVRARFTKAHLLQKVIEVKPLMTDSFITL